MVFSFKVFDNESTNNRKNNKNIDILNIASSGNKKISYVVKNQLMMNSYKGGKNKINIKLNTEKNKSAKEKNLNHLFLALNYFNRPLGS